ncbi:flagellar hook-associated protein FlgK [Sedimentitalea nanhaiensis]|uniref:Flagellar hook-associated protein 1 n=1 Tax=Sedimentitalea nanhaiensis TaxID=999627 RepID=A0A1I6Z335_9RHOB|nr:flagellar hook-associated protein FlgK [Sedimentitalea nanhaiensis]SFT57143.1 flagellar hook-associated protein 1 FlgK [Sedimentitalea nanhaiensis]
MSLTTALNSAMSGLTAASRATDVVSQNIANALTPGYARRSLEVTSATSTGSGVRIVGVQRHSDPVLVSDRRGADAEHSNAQTIANFHSRFEALVGTATDPTSYSMRLAEFENSLIAAASYSDSAQRLDAVVYAAKGLVASINDTSEGLRQMRTEADTAIGFQVDRLNVALEEVKKLNTRITSAQATGGDVSGLLDQRQLLIDGINQIVPVNQVDRDYGQIALYTDGGAILLDGSAATLDFTPVMDTVPEMTIGNGGLSGLTINGIPVSADKITGGTLAANFEIRDELSVSAQSDLDAVARDLIERFETASLDSTTAAGVPGLFTDDGAAFDPLLELGLAGRLRVNGLVDSDQGGESWRLRAGLGALDPGMPGDSRLLRAFSDVLAEARTPGSTTFGTGSATAADMGSSLLSRVAQNGANAEQRLGFASATQTELSRIELTQGVDTDAELQTLMLVEQAYAANARMIQAVDEMMETILGL